MNFILKCAVLLAPAVALAAPAFAGDRQLNDSQEPGSVIVYPKFIRNGTVTVDGITGIHRTEIEIGAVCPHTFNDKGKYVPGVCPEHQSVKVRFHWVCPGNQAFESKYICKETSFDVFLTVNGKLAFSADGTPINNNSPRVPAPACNNGYLIGWVISPANDQPVKFDGLIGDAVLRGPNLPPAAPVASTAVSAYKAITIQAADNEQPNFTGSNFADAQIKTDDGALLFDGREGHYSAVTGTLYGDVIYDKMAALTGAGNAFSNGPLTTTFLTLLTLDVRSNRPNNPTNVPLNFYNESLNSVSATNPNWEFLVDTSWEFICYTQVRLSQIDSNLTQEFMGSRKGVVVAGPAIREPFPIPDDPKDDDVRVTLLGLIHTTEGLASNLFQDRSYIYEMYNNSDPIRTRYLPF